MEFHKRPLTPIKEFEQACLRSEISEIDQKLIDYIRYIGVFTQPLLAKELSLSNKPPVLSRLCEICRKIGQEMPEHFDKVRIWSAKVNEFNVKWDGNLICSIAWNIDNERLTPEAGTAIYHTFTVHKELFQGLN